MSKLSKQTINRLKQVRDFLVEEPRRLDMARWGMKFDATNQAAVEVTGIPRVVKSRHSPQSCRLVWRTQDTPPCGTVVCMAGAAVHLFMPVEEFSDFLRLNSCVHYGDKVEWHSFPLNTPDVAQKLLDLDFWQRQTLFYTEKWPKKFRDMYFEATKFHGMKCAKKRAIALKQLINAFIKHDGDISTLKEKYGK